MKHRILVRLAALWMGVLLTVGIPSAFAAPESEKQVLITTRFVEVSQTDSDELGFDWLLGGTSAFSSTGQGSPQVVEVRSVDSTYRFTEDPLADVQGAPQQPPGGFGVAGVFTDPQFQVMIRALNQNKGVDLLTAPSVVTRSGQRAKIEIIREFIYPTEYDPADAVTSTLEGGDFFNPGETIIGIGGGAALGNLSQIHTTTQTERTTQTIERTERQQVQVGTQMAFINNQWIDVPVFVDQDVTIQEQQSFTEQIRQREIEGIMDEASFKLVMELTHYLNNNLGIGVQGEWIDGNLSSAFLGQAEVTWRAPIELPNMGVAPYFTGGFGVLSGDAINEIVGSLAAGIEVRPQSNLGFFVEYTHLFVGNGMDFGQVYGGIRIVADGAGKGGGSRVMPPSPKTFGERNSGVTLEVEPVVSADGMTIDLNLAPEVVEFEGFVNYGSPIQSTPVEGVEPLTESRIVGPVFSSRKQQTSVTVSDGQTVALGGLIREDIQDQEKKVPILGDLPIVGRLFRSNTEIHFKRNLQIFVTAELIDPSGERLR